MTLPPIFDHAFLWRVALSCAAVVASWILAIVLRWLVRRAGRAEWLQGIIIRSGAFAGWIDPSAESIRIFFGNLVYWVVLLAGAAAGLSIVSQQAAERLAEIGLVHFPKALLAAAVLGSGHWLAGYGSRAVLIAAASENLGCPWRWAAAARAGIMFTGIALASELTGIATMLIRSAYLIVLAGCVLLAVLAVAPALRASVVSQSTAEPSTLDDHVG